MFASFAPKLRFFSLLLITLGYYIYFTNYIDESFINPRISYNLANFGSLSFYENIKNQATVEIFQTIVSNLFFFKDVNAILVSYYITHYILILLSFYFIFKTFENYLKSDNFFILVILILSSGNLFKSASSGLGLNLLLLIFTITIYCYHKKKFLFPFLSGLLPIIRPDGILYSISFLISDIIEKKKISLLLIILPIIGYFFYFIFSFIYYENWPPPPMEFKSYSISHLINSLSEGSKYFEIIYFLKLHITYILLLFLVIFSNIYSHKNNFRKNLLNFFIQNKFIIVQLFSILGYFYFIILCQ